jgi:uncharacterized protein YeaO (DUF488 family)
VIAARVYDPSPARTVRVLVDRVWPRGLTKAAANLDEWCKDVAPSTELRRWYGHDPAKFEEFRKRYLREHEQDAPATVLRRLGDLSRQHQVALLTASRAIDISQAAVLADLLNRSG